MKKTLTFLLALALMLSLSLPMTGCGKGKDVSGIGTVELNDKTGGGVGTLGGNDDTPKEPSDTTTPAPQSPEGVETEKYEDASISMTIPKGWTVQYGTNEGGMYFIKVYDPANTSFCIMYYGVYEPLFPTDESRQLWSSQANSVYGYAPVITEPTAEQMLLHWNECAAVVEGLQMPVTFPALTSVSVIDSGTYKGAFEQYGATESEVVATCVSFKGADCGVYLCTAMILTDPKAIEGKDTSYYSSYQNFLIIAPQESWEAYYDTLKACLESIVSKSAAGIKGPQNSMGTITAP